jgi:hypothetical protein
MSVNRMAKLSGVAAIAVLLAGVAIAQGPGRMGERGWDRWSDDGPGYGMMGWGPRWGMWRGRGPDWMLDRVEGRLAFIKAELKVAESQTGAWNELAAAIRAAAKHHNERMQAVFSGAEDAKTRSCPKRWCKSADHGLSSMMARAVGQAAAMRLGLALGSSLSPSSVSRLM